MDDSDDSNIELDKCLFCLEPIKDEQVVNPKYCSCKIKLHGNCLTQIENNGLLCPICRKKPDNSEDFRIIRLYMIHSNEPFILWFPFLIFYRYPNFFSFALLVSWCFLVSIFFVLPQVIYHGFFDDRYRKYIVGGFCFVFGIIYYNYFPNYS